MREGRGCVWWGRPFQGGGIVESETAEGTGGDTAIKRGRPSSHSDGPVTVGKRVYINNMAPETSWQALKDHFKTAAPVVHADILAVRSYLAHAHDLCEATGL